jgi:hypothetical protein
VIRTQIYLTQQERTGLSSLAEKTGTTLSELVREAVNRYLVQSRSDRCDAVLKAAAGLWKDRQDLPDFKAARAGWGRGE